MDRKVWTEELIEVVAQTSPKKPFFGVTPCSLSIMELWAGGCWSPAGLFQADSSPLGGHHGRGPPAAFPSVPADSSARRLNKDERHWMCHGQTVSLAAGTRLWGWSRAKGRALCRSAMAAGMCRRSQRRE